MADIDTTEIDRFRRSLYVFYPLEFALKPPKDGFYKAFVNYYWAMDDSKLPALLFHVGEDRRKRPFPKCNNDIRIMEKLAPPWAKIQLIELAFIPIEVEEWVGYRLG